MIRPKSASRLIRYSTVSRKVREVLATEMTAGTPFGVVVVDSPIVCLWVDVGSPFWADQMEGN